MAPILYSMIHQSQIRDDSPEGLIIGLIFFGVTIVFLAWLCDGGSAP